MTTVTKYGIHKDVFSYNIGGIALHTTQVCPTINDIAAIHKMEYIVFVINYSIFSRQPRGWQKLGQSDAPVYTCPEGIHPHQWWITKNEKSLMQPI